MLQKNLQAYEYQHDTTNNPSRLLILRAKDISDFHAQNREKEGGQADDKYRRPQCDLDTSERNTHRQGIDAGGYRQKEHGLEIKGTAILSIFFLTPNGFTNHIGTHQEE